MQEQLRGTGEDREVVVKTNRLELEMLRPTIRTEWESENITCAKQQSDDVKGGRQKPPSHWLKFLLSTLPHAGLPQATHTSGREQAARSTSS